MSFALRLVDLGAASLWIDEVLVEMWRHQSPADAFSSLISFGSELPLYALVTRLFPAENELTLRLPSAFLGTIGTALTVSVTLRLYHDRSLALWSGALIATNPLHVWLSRTARAYALLFVLALLTTALFLHILSGSRSRSMWAAFVAASAAAYLTHYFSLYLLLAQAITIVRHGSRDARRRWIAAQGLAVLPFALWSAQIVILNVLSGGRFLGGHGDWLPSPGLLDLPVTLANLITGYDGRAGAWWWIPAMLAAGFGLWRGVGIAIRQSPTPSTGRHLVLLAILPFALTFALAQFRPVYLDRYFVVGMPALIILVATGWGGLRSRWLRVALPALVILTGAAAIAMDLRATIHEKIAWRRAGAFLAGAVQPGDGILLDRRVARDPFLRYFSRNTDDLVLWAWTEGDGVPLADLLPQRYPARLWIVIPNPHSDLHRQGALPDFDPLEPGLTPLGGWLAQQSRVAEAASFTEVKVLLLSQGHGGPGR